MGSKNSTIASSFFDTKQLHRARLLLSKKNMKNWQKEYAKRLKLKSSLCAVADPWPLLVSW